MPYSVFRAAAKYRLVVIVEPADARTNSPDAKFQVFTTDGYAGYPKETFGPIDRMDVLSLLGSRHDELGYAARPDVHFNTPGEVIEWITMMRGKEAVKKQKRKRKKESEARLK
jgi:hypothetical protein